MSTLDLHTSFINYCKVPDLYIFSINYCKVLRNSSQIQF